MDRSEQYLALIHQDLLNQNKQQEVANLLTIANTPGVPENIRNQALNAAMSQIGLATNIEQQFNQNQALPNDLIR